MTAGLPQHRSRLLSGRRGLTSGTMPLLAPLLSALGRAQPSRSRPVRTFLEVLLAPAVDRARGDTFIASAAGAFPILTAHGSIARYALGASERAIQRPLTRQLRPSDVLYKSAASVGSLTLIGGRPVGEGRGVVAVEPFAELASAVRRKIGLDSLEQRLVPRCLRRGL